MESLLFPHLLFKTTLGEKQLIPLPLRDLFWFSIHHGLRGPEFTLIDTCPWTNAVCPPIPPCLFRTAGRSPRAGTGRVVKQSEKSQYHFCGKSPHATGTMKMRKHPDSSTCNGACRTLAFFMKCSFSSLSMMIGSKIMPGAAMVIREITTWVMPRTAALRE